MNISYISNSACPSKLPSSLQIVKTCEYLSKYGNQVFLILPNTYDTNLSIFNFYNIKYKFEIIRLFRFKKFPIGLNYYLFSFLSFLKAKKISDLIITRNYFVTFLCFLFRKKCIIELHNDIINESRIVRLIYSIFNILNSKSVLKIICISQAVKKKYVDDFGLNNKKNIIVLPSGSSLDIKYKNSLNRKRLKLGYFGTINPSRGINIILKLAQTDKQNDYYIFGGSKEQIENLKKKYKLRNLYLKPYQHYKIIQTVFSKMDILLMPYSNKVTVSGNVSNTAKFMSPLKLFDYMSAGRLIISSDIEVLREVVNHNHCIFVKNYLNPISWLHEIKKIKNNLIKRNIIGKNSYKKSKIYSHKYRVLRYLEK